jgi:hypothetical protein
MSTTSEGRTAGRGGRDDREVRVGMELKSPAILAIPLS